MNKDTTSTLELFSLEGKCALVTGASSGIGRAIAVGLAGAGARVGINGTSRAKLEDSQRLINRIGATAEIFPVDLKEVDNCRQLVAEAHRLLGRIDILVNCAGTNRRNLIDRSTPEDFDFLMAVNLKSAYLLSQAVYPVMKAQGGGKIINIGSVTSFIGLGTVSIYGMTKAGLAHLTKSMAVEWAKDNIQVNCLAPGFIKTPLTSKEVFGNPHRAQWLLDRIPARRAGEPEDMVGVALLLASRASDYLTGQIIAVDGGFLAGGSWEPENR